MKRASFVGRSIVAVALLIGFYILALGIAAGLLWVVYAQVVIAKRLIPKLALICVVLAGMIVWSVLPRWDRFDPPGPRIDEGDHPRLFALIHDIARRTGQRPPSEVYLVADVNAFVAQRGGVMGFFSRRVMGLGVPLMSLLTVSQLSAVLAHELGHYHGGDTMLGPWIYKTRSAIGRTIIALAEGGSTVVRKPFEWYGTLFLKVTHAISRAQELAADELAARVVGAKHLIAGLKAVHGGSAAFNAFLQAEFLPVLSAGYRTPLGQGFRAFLDDKRLKAALDRIVTQEIEDPDDDELDTHPPLAQRIAALARFDDATSEADDTPAIELLGECDAAEAGLIADADAKPLRPLAWSKVAERVLLPQWQNTSNGVAAELGKVTLTDLVKPPARLGKLAARVLERDLSEDPEAAARIGANLAAATVCCTLAHAGWQIKNRVGRPVVMRNGEHRLSPFKDFAALVDGKLDANKLVARLAAADVGHVVVHTTKVEARRD